MNAKQTIFFVALLSGSWLAGCSTTSPTEEAFGDAVRNMVAEQKMAPSGPLRADEPIRSGDGRRLENVTTVYQSNVGDPSPVVKQVNVERGGQ